MRGRGGNEGRAKEEERDLGYDRRERREEKKKKLPEMGILNSS